MNVLKSELLASLPSSKFVIEDSWLQGVESGRFCCCFHIAVSYLEKMHLKDFSHLGRDNAKDSETGTPKMTQRWDCGQQSIIHVFQRRTHPLGNLERVVFRGQAVNNVEWMSREDGVWSKEAQERLYKDSDVVDCVLIHGVREGGLQGERSP